MKARDFRGNWWNLEHATRHGWRVHEIEMVVRNAGRGFPSYVGNGKWMVIGRGIGQRVVRVIYLLDANETIYVIHAMPLTTRRRRS